MNLVASLIVKNELDRYLPLAVKHLLSFCNEIRVVDDYSEDGTFEWLSGQERVSVIRSPELPFYTHEGRARQALYGHVLEAKPTYVLAIDADEFIGDPDCILSACKKGGPVYTLQMTEVWHARSDGIDIRIDGLWKARTVPILYQPQAGWTIRDAELACGREPREVVAQYGSSKPTGSTVLHFGWARKSERVARAARYDVHDGGKYHQDRHLRSILWEEQGNRQLRLQNTLWPVGLADFAEEICAVANR